MAKKTNIEKDHGLDVRMFFTGLALVVLYVIIITVLLRVGVALGFVVVIAFALIFSQYYFSDKVAMFSMHAKEVTPAQEPKLHEIVDRLCLLANMTKPRVAVSEMDIPNAFATGRNPNHAVICATRGLMRRLSDEELEAVLAHELSHVAHRDVAIMTIASGVGMLAGLIGRMAMWGAMLGGGGRGKGGDVYKRQALDRPDAPRRAGGDDGDQRRSQRGAARRADPEPRRRGPRRRARGLPPRARRAGHGPGPRSPGPRPKGKLRPRPLEPRLPARRRQSH